MKAELNHFDRAIRTQLEICLDSENLAEELEQKKCWKFLPKKIRIYMLT